MSVSSYLFINQKTVSVTQFALMLARSMMVWSKSEELYAATLHAVIVIPLIGGMTLADVVSEDFPGLKTGK